jgi:segregation and condensation protein B
VNDHEPAPDAAPATGQDYRPEHLAGEDRPVQASPGGSAAGPDGVRSAGEAGAPHAGTESTPNGEDGDPAGALVEVGAPGGAAGGGVTGEGGGPAGVLGAVAGAGAVVDAPGAAAAGWVPGESGGPAGASVEVAGIGAVVDGREAANQVDGAAPGPDTTPDGQRADQHAVPPGPGGVEFDVDDTRLRSAVEAILFVVDRPTSAIELAQVLDVPRPAVTAALAALRTDLDEQVRGFELREVAGGWRLYTREEFAPYVERYVLDGQQARLTQAALETLAVVAYRQPVTRSRISAIRGVSVDGVIRTLLSRSLIEECGNEPGTGGLLYRTTPLFLEKLGLQSIDELPSLAPLLPELETVEDVAPST